MTSARRSRRCALYEGTFNDACVIDWTLEEATIDRHTAAGGQSGPPACGMDDDRSCPIQVGHCFGGGAHRRFDPDNPISRKQITAVRPGAEPPGFWNASGGRRSPHARALVDIAGMVIQCTG